MGNIHSTYSDYVRYFLTSEYFPPLLIKTPIGWRDDTIELDRHKDYFGIFTTFTGKLSFKGEAKRYIQDVYDTGGVNAKLILVKQVTRDLEGDVKWNTRYYGYADFLKKTDDDTITSLNFNSNNLTEIVKSHEGDKVEIERITDINGDAIEEMVKTFTEIKGRSLEFLGELKAKLRAWYGDTEVSYEQQIIFDKKAEEEWGYAMYTDTLWITPTLEVVSEGNERQFTQPEPKAYPNTYITADNFFYVNETLAADPTDISCSYDIEFTAGNSWNNNDRAVYGCIRKYKFNGAGVDFTFVSEIVTFPYVHHTGWTAMVGSFKTTLDWDECLMFMLRTDTESGDTVTYRVKKAQIKINATTTFEASQNVRFAFIHDIGQRLMYILSGKNDTYYSKYFGRIGINDYGENNIGSHIGAISGLWVRGFEPGSEKYKSLTISWKEYITSLQATFNIGLGVETTGLNERFRIEEQKYFFQNEVVIKLPYPIINVKRKVSPGMFYSGVEMGYLKGGDYDGEGNMGLDEPNTHTTWITAIHNSTKKYKRKSVIRADEYAMELTRRKPQITFPLDDTRRDEANWYLDLKTNDVGAYTQVDWQDRLASEPRNIADPDSFRSMLFTPQQCLFRHGWIVRAGLEVYLEKKLTYGSSGANSQLIMEFTGEVERQENSDVINGDLDRSRFLPEEITFEHAVDDDLLDLILNTTKINYRGVDEQIPNYYFKFEWINEVGIQERGYLLNLKPQGNGKFTFQKANENTLE